MNKKLVLFVIFLISGCLAFPSSSVNLLAKYGSEDNGSKDDEFLYKGGETVLKDDEPVYDPRDLPNIIPRMSDVPEDNTSDISTKKMKGDENQIMEAEGPNDIIEDDQQFNEVGLSFSNKIENDDNTQEENDDTSIDMSNEIEKEGNLFENIQEDDEAETNIKEERSNDIKKESSQIDEIRTARKLRKLRRKSFEIGFMQGFLEAFVDQELIRPKFRRNIKSLRNEVFGSWGKTNRIAKKMKKLI
ncbi:hypothetical protein ACFFRR_007366 [Megaselia abdita]